MLQATQQITIENNQPSGYSFDEWWQHYPRKTAKAEARKAWKQVKPSPSLVQIMITDIQHRLDSGHWSLREKKFIPHPATYLRGERWEDEIVPRHRTDAAVVRDTQGMIDRISAGGWEL